MIPFETRPPGVVPYLNIYLANGGVIMPIAERPEDDRPSNRSRSSFPIERWCPCRATASVTGAAGPHCITQQLPTGVPVPA